MAFEYQKLEEVHRKIHNGEVSLRPYEMINWFQRGETISPACWNIWMR